MPLVPSTLATISVLPGASTIMVGSTEQLQPVAKDQNGKVITGIDFTFSSSSGAASVSQTGLVKGVAAGSSIIDVSAGEKSTSLTITVTAPPPVLTQISVSPSTASIAAGQSQTYTAVGYDQFNNLMSGITFTWASDGNGSVATLNGNVAIRRFAGNGAHHGVGFRHQQRACHVDGSAASAGVNQRCRHTRRAFDFYRRNAATHRCGIRPERKSDERPRVRVGKLQPERRCRGRQWTRQRHLGGHLADQRLGPRHPQQRRSA